MTIGSLVLYVALAALVLTLIIGFVGRKVENWPISFLQNFCGVLFIFSGWVKAVDPLGTAYKMEQYFAEFEATFEYTAMSWMAPLFPWLAEYASSFSVAVIVFEMVLGLMLLIGAYRRFTSWAFLLLVAFFTFLTGFTYLTGYVPEGVNFFSFKSWGPYVETNMKVTDCGCFGDFLKLEPKVSFLKDIFLLVPALAFVFFTPKMHQLFTANVRNGLVLTSILALTVYCFSNYVWDLPHVDFRPFKEGADVAEQKAAEREAMENVEITAYKLTEKTTGKVIEVPYEQFLNEYEKYPKDQYEFEQVKSEPAIPITKISDFEIAGPNGEDVTDQILDYGGYQFMLVAHKLHGKSQAGKKMVKDTLFRQDTLMQGDSLIVQPVVDTIVNRQVATETYDWDPEYVQRWQEVVNPVMAKAQAEDIRVFAVTKAIGAGPVNDFKQVVFRESAGLRYPFLNADDILLKTIIRSNPGIVLMKEGKVIKKWHYRKLPDFEELKSEYLTGE